MIFSIHRRDARQRRFPFSLPSEYSLLEEKKDDFLFTFDNFYLLLKRKRSLIKKGLKLLLFFHEIMTLKRTYESLATLIN